MVDDSRRSQSPWVIRPNKATRGDGKRWRLRLQVSHANSLRSTALVYNGKRITGHSPLKTRRERLPICYLLFAICHFIRA